MSNRRNRKKPPAPPPPPPKPPETGWMRFWKEAKKWLFSPIKLPAWLVYFIAAYRLIPDLLGETDWWWDRARSVGGLIGLGAGVIASPYLRAQSYRGRHGQLLWRRRA